MIKKKRRTAQYERKNNLSKLLLRKIFLLSFLFLVYNQQIYAFFTNLENYSSLDKIDIYLQTIDTGNNIYDNFAHTALRIHDRNTGRDIVYNWGIFDFSDPISFSLKFYRGILNYKLGYYPYSRALAYYKLNARSVWQDKLNLKNKEKEILLSRINWNLLPKNREYAYHYFFDNCSTRIRDYLDEAISGQLKEETQYKITNESFRDMIRKGYETNPFVDVSLDILMNSRIDKKISLWEKMFHPFDLRKNLMSAGINLITPKTTQTLLDYPRLEPFPLSGYQIIFIYFSFFIFLSLSVYLYQKRKKIQNYHLSLFYRFLGIGCFPIACHASVTCLLMPITWIVSAHKDLHHNINIIAFLPFDFIFLLVSLTWITKGRPIRLKHNTHKWFKKLIVFHIIVSLSMLIMYALNLYDQNNSRLIYNLFPIYLISLILYFTYGSSVFIKKDISVQR